MKRSHAQNRCILGTLWERIQIMGMRGDMRKLEKKFICEGSFWTSHSCVVEKERKNE